MAAKIYDKIPIVETARRCGLVLDSRTLRRKEVEASCPFCGDHGPGKYHLSLNTDTDQYRCNLCGAHGNSVSLYARIKGICNKEAYLELAREARCTLAPSAISPNTGTAALLIGAAPCRVFGYAGASDASPKTRRESLRTGLERRAHPKKRVSQYAGNRARASAFGRPPAQSRP